MLLFIIYLALLCLTSIIFAENTESIALAFNYWPGFYTQFMEAGPIVDMRYQVIPRPPNRDMINFDFREKIWCAMQILSSSPDGKQKLRLTVVRLDNMMDHKDERQDFGCKDHDTYWRETPGWPTDLSIVITSNNYWNIHVPPNNFGDILQMDLDGFNMKLVSNKAREIPRTIFQVTTNHRGQYVPLLHKCSTLTRIMNPNWEYRGLALDQTEALVSLTGNTRALQALNMIRPVAYKIDLVRLVLLYHYGGVYTDTRLVPLVSYETFLPSKGGLVPMDADQSGYYNAFLALPKHSQLARAGIEQIISNVEHRYYGTTVLDPTGPHALYQAYISMLSQAEREKISVAVELEHHEARFIRNRQTLENLVVVHNSEYRRRFTFRDSNHYVLLYNQRRVYMDQ